MTSATTLSDAASVAARPPRLLGLYLLLIIMAAIEAFEGLSHAPMLFGDMSEIPGPGLGGAIITAYVASHPLLALAALAFATIGRLRYAIIALGALVLMNWLNYMPSVMRHGLDFGGLSAFQTPVQIIAFPLMGACAIALAIRQERLGLAALLVSIPTLFDLLAVIAFGISVFLYGF
ncbi:hypothetical protein CQ14_21625 [Bradyrhizobium lablabi]|uniref:Uncharacterized protein n=1 Tax=Bradyrhizobium lablabi TaxID=722472 RepID=A0A0R3MTH3_9BRAD|nr:hypothetical protein [Bradyrhizobium lablabi]KRR21085.1 hypothetical protein CQ14_21625 [Bradyrhizobium lablabi]